MQLLFRLLITYFCCIPLVLNAETIVVTSTADSGPGTLREAIEKAGANGHDTPDYIHFNLPGASMAERTITLLSALPVLGSNIEIDGTTQPGAAFGVSDARVKIFKDRFMATGQFFNMLSISNAANIAIYGLYMEFAGEEDGATCIAVSKSSNITIGGMGKGNVLLCPGSMISCDAQLEPGNTNTVHIAYNILGLQPDGRTHGGYRISYPSVLIFGAGEVEMHHNLLQADVSISEDNRALVTGKRTYRIYDNRGVINAGGAMTQSSVSFTIRSYSWGTPSPENLIEVRNNHFERGGFAIGAPDGRIVVQGNKFNTDQSGTVRTGVASPLAIYWCREALIGGDAESEKNYLAGGSYGVDVYDITNRVVISKNSIFCNGVKGIKSVESVFVETFDGTTISGRSEPEAVIEVFEADEKCYPSADCAGKRFIGSTTASAAGKWSFSGALPAEVVVTGTGKTGSTSEFTRATISTRNFMVIPAICDKPGSIKGVYVTGAVAMHWEDERGNIVSYDAEPASLEPGTYTLRASANNNLHSVCASKAMTIKIDRLVPSVTTERVTVVKPCKGMATGSIAGMNVNGTYGATYKWLNEKDEVVGTASKLENVPAGTYRLGVYNNPECFAISAPVVLTEQEPPVINMSAITITPATCQDNNGAISGLSLTGIEPFSLNWKNDAGSYAGNTLNLQNVVPGTYKLLVKDGSDCPAITSGPVTITGTGMISIDAGNVKIQPAGCNNLPGAVTGITVTGADAYTWRNRSGDVVGRSITLADVPAGDYQLTATNAFACSAQTAWYTVGITQPVKWAVTVQVQLPECNEANGQLSAISIQGGTLKEMKWVNGATAAWLGNERVLKNVGPGAYELYVTDQNNCEQLGYTINIPRRILPVITGPPIIRDETCGLSNGAIRVPGISGEGPFLLRWTNESGTVAGTQLEIKGIRNGVYQLQAKDKHNCTVLSEPYVVNNIAGSIPPPPDLSVTIGKGQAAVVTVAYNSPVVFTLYADASLSSRLQENTTGVFNLPALYADSKYYVTVRMNNCISDAAVVRVTVIESTEVEVPTAFSPNGDGRNDLFRPLYRGIASIQYFKVYNRWGSEVFSTNKLGDGWNGRLNGMELPAGNYFFSISGKDMLAKPFLKHGTVLLLR